MYTRKEVAKGKYAIKAETPEEAKVIVEMFPDKFTVGVDWTEIWKMFKSNTCYIPIHGTYMNEAAAGAYYTIIPLSSISDLSEQSGEGVSKAKREIEVCIDCPYNCHPCPEGCSKVVSIQEATPTPIGRDIGEITDAECLEFGRKFGIVNTADIEADGTGYWSNYVRKHYLTMGAPNSYMRDMISGGEKCVFLMSKGLKFPSIPNKVTPSPVSEVSEDWNELKQEMVCRMINIGTGEAIEAATLALEYIQSNYTLKKK